MTELMKLTVAAQAALLLMGLDHDYFSRVLSVVLFPTAFANRRYYEVSLALPAWAVPWDFDFPSPEPSQLILTLLPDALSTRTPPEF